jgi:Fe2+ transport system protein FeoA
MFGGCRLVRCPHCGAEMPAEPRIVGWLRRRLTGPLRPPAAPPEAANDPGVGRLSDGTSGAVGTVARLEARDGQEARKLMAVGILPGTRIELIQRFPAFVFQVGNSQFAVDRPLAEVIFVRWAGARG